MVDSSSSSAGSSFRELDDVFLQTQTRIWLGEVLGTRLDEDLPISELLRDGEILLEVSKVLWNLLLTKKELRHLKQKFGPFGSKKISGRYRPYSNIDSFLKICKILGLGGIDLFSPSDVVEKKNIRKVCICIRALSKKARSKLLTVPDFNVVRYSVPMSTDMVGVLRRSLESPQNTVSSSSSYTPRKGSVIKSTQKKLYLEANRDEDSSSDESDEAESRYMGGNSLSPADQENSPEAHPMSRYSCRNGTSNSNCNDAFEKDYSVVGDSFSINVGENNYISEYLAFSDLMVHANNGDSPVILDGDKNMFDFFLNLDSQESGKRAQYCDDEDIEVSSTTSMGSVLGRLLNLEFDDQFDEDESSSADIYSYESKVHGAEKQHGDLFEQSKIDTFETQPETALNQEAQSKLAPGVLLAPTEQFPSSQEKCELSCLELLSSGPQTGNPENDVCLNNRDVTDANQETLLGEDKGNETAGTTIHGSKTDVVHLDNHISNNIHVSDVSSNDITFSCDGKSDKNERSGEQLHNPVVSNGTRIVQEDTCEILSDNHPCFPVKDTELFQEDSHLSNDSQDNNISAAENGTQDNREHQLHTREENISDREKELSTQMPPGKHRRRLVLETVVKGTAIAGVLFLLMQIRKIKGNDAKESERRAQVSKKNGVRLTTTKPSIGGMGKRMYPTDRIRL